MKKVDVIINRKSDYTDMGYTYLCSDEYAKVGNMVMIPFGRGNQLKEGCIIKIQEMQSSKDEENTDAQEKEIKLKEVAELCENHLTEEMVNTAKWMTERYYCRLYDCIELFLPPSGGESKRKIKPVHGEPIEEKAKIETLTAEQEQALREVEIAIDKEEQNLFLIKGVTGSGKTQVYISAIEKLIEKDKTKTAIMLVPEISLTKQIIDRFSQFFGKEQIAVLHSRLTKKQKYEQWKNIKEGNVKVVIGARSAIFAPLKNIGLIILDEEHESTYKSDQTPKYETVEVAIKRAKVFGGSIILGSATPAVVSYERAKEGIYKLLEMKERYNKCQLPEVKIVDVSEELKAGNRTSISRELYKEMSNSLEKGKQIILFLNRRGYATYIGCNNCGYVAKCEDCQISLTYHKGRNTWECHYCGKKIKNTKICPECKEASIVQRGYGTEKVEEEIRELFPNYNVERLDLDTSQKAGFLEKTLRNFSQGKIQILMGTQIVAKGLDFENVGLVGIISADMALNIPDFRSTERCFQLIVQAAGRAGRGEEKGRVIIQTLNKENYAIICGGNQDYEGFFNKEIEIRRYLKYPPFSDLIQIVVSSKEKGLAENRAEKVRDNLKILLGNERENNIYGPTELISNQKESYKYHILIKSPKEEKGIYRGAIKAIRDNFLENKGRFSKEDLQILIDINPYSMWRG